MKRTLILSAVLALITSVSVYAGEGKGKPPGGGPGHYGDMGLLPPKLREDLALTADQQAKVKEIEAQFTKARDDWKAANPGDPKLHEEMKAAREAGDKAKSKELGEKMRAQMQPLMDLRKQSMEKVRAVLTPEQVKKLDEAREAFGKHHGKPDAAK